MTQSDLLEVEIGPVAHGGHCVARHDGRVIFVRHAIPGERGMVRITERAKSFWRGDFVEVLEASAHRVSPPCDIAGVCGGCDFQHIDPDHQLDLLTSVVAEQLSRLAGITWDGRVEAVGESLGWRTRMQWTVGPNGLVGLKQHRSHNVVPVSECPIAHPHLPTVTGRVWEAEQLFARVTSTGERVLVVDRDRVEGDAVVRERVHGHDFEVDATGFWQVHPAAAQTLVDAVLEVADLRPGDRVLDLYGGVGLFAHFLAGEQREVISVEGNRRASQLARKNLAGRAGARHGDVAALLRRGALGTSADVVVLDPPRTGAKPAVRGIAGLSPRRIIYVACDPAALARDLASFASRGYELVNLRAFALFPMTHHVECVALLIKPGSDLR